MAFKFSEVFHDCIINVLYQVIGEKGMRVILFHIELGNYLDDPAKLHKDLSAIFSTGAKLIEKLIVKELYRRLDLPFEDKESFDFAEYIEHARKLFMARIKEISPGQAVETVNK